MIYLLSMCMMLALTACNDDGNEPASNSNITPQFEITLPSSLDSLGGKSPIHPSRSKTCRPVALPPSTARAV